MTFDGKTQFAFIALDQLIYTAYNLAGGEIRHSYNGAAQCVWTQKSLNRITSHRAC